MPSNSRVDRLKQILTLEQRRAVLQDELDSLVQQIKQLSQQLFDGGSAPVVSVAPVKIRAAASPTSSSKRTKRGALKAQILSALQSAGAAGVKVKELAAKLGTKPVNIHSWFHSALKNNKSITKIKGGHYRLASGAASVATASESSTGASKPAKARKKGSKRGQVTASILAELKAAGPSGISVGDLSKKLGAPYKNVYIWFATTGKKQPGLKKIAPATYSLQS